MAISKIKETLLLFINDPKEDYNAYKVFFVILRRLLKDRLFVRNVPINEFAYHYGLDRGDIAFIVNYCTGLEYADFIELLRILDTFALSRRYETFGLDASQISKLSNCNAAKADRFVFALMDISLKGFIYGLKNRKMVELDDAKRKGIASFRNLQQKRNTAFIKDIRDKYNNRPNDDR